MKIAIIGSGISGLTAAYCLNKHHDITLFEKNTEIGGHTATKPIELNGFNYAIDTGFIVYNDWTYPTFIRLLKQLGVKSQPTTMGFSLSAQNGAYEYSGNNLNTLFAQRKNLFNIDHLSMIRDILRFNKQALRDLANNQLTDTMTLGDYLKTHRYSQSFIDFYLIPMGCAIWSSPTQNMLDFPLLFFVRFFKNHGLLAVNNRPQWYVLQGGSSSYLPEITASFQDKIRTGVNIDKVLRDDNRVTLRFNNQAEAHFDQVIFACHSDEALALLDQPTDAEKATMGCIKYQENQVILHHDERLLPKRKRVWSSWNYRLDSAEQSRAILTYNMNILQNIDSNTVFCVTLNARESIRASRILGEYTYSHPVFTEKTVAAQKRWGDINGSNRSWFCGAYWANGFHEDGCLSGLRVAQALGGDL